MDIVKVTSSNLHIYLNLCQSYEGEFSSITRKKPNPDGLFELDTPIGSHVSGYLLYDGAKPLGFMAVDIQSDGNSFEICEFYIVPACRKKGLGRDFVNHIFRMHKGIWEVKQISGAEYATEFWRKVIQEFTGGKFQEDSHTDAYWGKIIRHRFRSV
ncbi:GNAT family N-acetyltransferase [Desulfobotulus sp. H1]|uniref:GNAT family N-acetyltransferase n=1 Tax=Desulfobotulus pelophilus TaxID=2823377 RepID=A0ABT3N7I4_9BACT|nr:GNAT family N-acetyltransferase [Desulfobotulus pelophilus]MCW7753413.1 GNAT family N-acetyltransferase [Desulfobotulus pelophilus]